MKRELKTFIADYRRAALTLVHLGEAALANYLAFFLRFDMAIPAADLERMFFYLPFLLAIRLVFFALMGLHRDFWRYFSVEGLMRLAGSAALGSAVFIAMVRYAIGDAGYPLSIYVLDWLLLVMVGSAGALLIRIYRQRRPEAAAKTARESGRRKILVIGAGDAGEMIARDMLNNPEYGYDPIGFIDDDKHKTGLVIHGRPIFGARESLASVIKAHRPHEILIAMPSAGRGAVSGIYELCKPHDIPIKTLPGLGDILGGRISVTQIKPLRLEDLLQRKPVSADMKAVGDYIRGKAVLVTGAGGSIGSELSRQIIAYGPSKLLLFDRCENGLFAIGCELAAKDHDGLPDHDGLRDHDGLQRRDGENGGGGTKVVSIVGDMLDEAALERLFSAHAPHIVFHAAAHKHVPLMENNPLEAVKNNIFGTDSLIKAACRHGARSFVMISTDKAVNPANMMGATKRVAEFLAMATGRASGMKSTTVRFGNVLGSSGSVVPIFREQLRRGGPLTVTHPEVKRFFMLTDEAVHLVLVAAARGRGGEIFVLDMGRQIRILDLAENLIKLSGFAPHKDVKIEFTGLRPGEKLFEELFDETEMMQASPHERLTTAVPAHVPSREAMRRHLAMLGELVSRDDVEGVFSEIQKIVPNFKKEATPQNGPKNGPQNGKERPGGNAALAGPL